MNKKFIRLLLFFLVSTSIIAVFLGRFNISNYRSLKSDNSILSNLIRQIRVPRIIASIIIGFGLSVSGLVMQSIFKNPLADPGFLGVNQAAGFGAALAILFFHNSFILMQISAFFFGLLALGLTIAIASRIKTNEQYALVLSGIAISAFFSAFLGILKYAADPLDELPSIVYWLLGSNSGTNWQLLIRILPLFIICISFLYLKRWRINAFSIDKNVQFALGIRDYVELYQILIASVLLTTTIVSFSGIIGWVGLIIPNIGRLLGGQDVKKSMVLTVLMGGVFVLICDTIARTALAGEIPLGILTSLVGASAFLVLLVKSQSIG